MNSAQLTHLLFADESLCMRWRHTTQQRSPPSSQRQIVRLAGPAIPRVSFRTARWNSRLRSRHSWNSWTPVRILLRQSVLFRGTFSHDWRGALQRDKLTWITSWYRSLWRLGFRFSAVTYPYNSCFGIRLSSILLTCPNHRIWLSMSMSIAAMKSIPVQRSTSVLGTMSGHRLPKILRTHCK